ncbi:major tail protein [Citrobacter phage HCF1]|uniref:Tail tube protein n=1 Tax=Citrobacter phage HCF1 TaxID=2849700 RepID=A0ABX6D737_9CAUD|nr:major tail protein [Citrobacter phage HCF1]
MHLPNGSQIFVENMRGESKDATAITNAIKPVLTVAEGGTDFAKGDYIIVTAASWGKLIDRVLRVTASTETEVTVEGIDTSDTNVFPAGNVTATFAKITGWTEIPCVQDLGQDGGEQQYYTYQCLSDDRSSSYRLIRARFLSPTLSRTNTITRFIRCCVKLTNPAMFARCACTYRKRKKCVAGLVFFLSTRSRRPQLTKWKPFLCLYR